MDGLDVHSSTLKHGGGGVKEWRCLGGDIVKDSFKTAGTLNQHGDHGSDLPANQVGFIWRRTMNNEPTHTSSMCVWAF